MIEAQSIENLQVQFSRLKPHEQRKYLNSVIAFLANTYFANSTEYKDDTPLKTTGFLSGATSLIHSLIKRSEVLQDHLVDSLTKSPLNAIEGSLDMRRSVISAISQEEGEWVIIKLGHNTYRKQKNCITSWKTV